VKLMPLFRRGERALSTRHADGLDDEMAFQTPTIKAPNLEKTGKSSPKTCFVQKTVLRKKVPLR